MRFLELVKADDFCPCHPTKSPVFFSKRGWIDRRPAAPIRVLNVVAWLADFALFAGSPGLPSAVAMIVQGLNKCRGNAGERHGPIRHVGRVNGCHLAYGD